MKTGIRIIILTVMLAMAVTMATFTIAGFSSRADAREEEPRGPGGAYLLGELDGSVAVFDAGDMKTPLRVTGIEMDSLRRRDREMIAAGLPVATKEELAQLLEDLGS